MTLWKSWKTSVTRLIAGTSFRYVLLRGNTLPMGGNWADTESIRCNFAASFTTVSMSMSMLPIEQHAHLLFSNFLSLSHYQIISEKGSLSYSINIPASTVKHCFPFPGETPPKQKRFSPLYCNCYYPMSYVTVADSFCIHPFTHAHIHKLVAGTSS